MCELIISSNSIYVMMSNGDRERKMEREGEMKKVMTGHATTNTTQRKQTIYNLQYTICIFDTVLNVTP